MDEIIYNILKIIKESEERIVKGEPLQRIAPFNLKVNDKAFGMAILRIEEEGLAKVSYAREGGIPVIVFDDNAMILKEGLKLLSLYDMEKLIDSVDELEESEKVELKQISKSISSNNLEDNLENESKVIKFKEYLKKLSKETGKVITDTITQILSQTAISIMQRYGIF